MRSRHVVAVSVILSISVLAAMVLVARFLWVHKAKDNPHATNELSDDSIEQQKKPLSRDSRWKQLFAQKRKHGHCTPTLSGVIKSGDEAIISSALFNGQHGFSLEQLYHAFANELRARPSAERSKYPSETSKFLSGTPRLQRGQSLRVTQHERQDVRSRSPRHSVDLSELGVRRSRSRRVQPNLVPTLNALPQASNGHDPTVGSWAQDVQYALYFDGLTGIRVSPQEVLALSVILGSPIDIFSTARSAEKMEGRVSVNGGAYGTSISVARTKDGKYRMSFQQQRRTVSQLPARGSGYSTLFAKHLASGSLPLSLEAKTIKSIAITTESLDLFKTGTAIQLKVISTKNAASKFLVSLPNLREPTLLAPTSSTITTETPLLLHAIAALPFVGGLSPLASRPLIDTVQFVASAGLVPGRLLQRLDALVEKVHRHSPHLQLFGPLYDNINAGLLYRERERLGKLATGAITDEPLVDKVARMHRYVTLLERLMAIVPDMTPEKVLAAVRENMQKEIERSYNDAVAVHNSGTEELFPSAGEGNLQSTFSQRSTRRSKRSSSSSFGAQTPGSLSSPRMSMTFPPNNLGRQVEGTLRSSLPFDVQTIALIARMVLVAWTQSVEAVTWEEGEEGFRVPDINTLPEKMYMW